MDWVVCSDVVLESRDTVLVFVVTASRCICDAVSSHCREILEPYAEYIAAFDTSKEVVWICKFIYGLNVVPIIEEPITMYCDNTEAIAIANDHGVTKGVRHFHAKVHYLRETIELGDVRIAKVDTDDNLADPFTKALVFPKHSELTRKICLIPASSLIWWKLAQELKLVRNQLLHWYLWPMASLTDLSLSEHRVELTKSIAFIVMIDDIFDVYGTLDQLIILTQTVNRFLFALLVDGKVTITPWIDLCEAFLAEAKWFAEGYMPTAEDYLNNGMDVDQDGNDGSYVTYYMKENADCSIQKAHEHVMEMISDTWKQLNAECLYSSHFSHVIRSNPQRRADFLGWKARDDSSCQKHGDAFDTVVRGYGDCIMQEAKVRDAKKEKDIRLTASGQRVLITANKKIRTEILSSLVNAINGVNIPRFSACWKSYKTMGGKENKLTNRMRCKGLYLALHLKMEKDFWVRKTLSCSVCTRKTFGSEKPYLALYAP
ncbi:retrotransposon protein, putative, ty1-copia subclass [Tanacetum coccineum]